jgi:KRAB domain-containing zinc finger protein
MTHAQTSLICHICGKTLKTKLSYEFHVKRHADVREFQCPRCPASFVYIKKLERHMIGHSEDRKYICEQPGCTKTFKDVYTFHIHQKRHNGTLVRKYACTFQTCEKKFVSKYALDRHTLTHTLQKPHQCEYCEMAYAQKNDLIKHMKIHVGDDIYRCTIDGCLEGFRLQADLKRHYAVHYLKN